MSFLRIDRTPSLRKPVLVMAFAGWNDAGQAATSAVGFLVKRWSARRFASIDPEEFFDFTATRPTIRLAPGFQRELEWPSNVFLYHTGRPPSRDVVLLLGTEPHLKWRTFTEAVLELVHQVDAGLIVSLGAFLGEAPHSRPVPLTGFATEPSLAEKLEKLGITPSRYEGPTGIIGTVHDACRREGLASASLWAAAPHYLGATTNPKAAAALLRSLGALLDLDLDLALLEEAAARFEAEVAQAVARNPEISEYVRELEQRADAASEAAPTAPADAGELPSGEVVVEELEEFLRSRREEEEEE